MNKKNTLIGIFIIIALLAVAFLAYQFISNKIEQRQEVVPTRELTEREKIIQQQIKELDALREKYQARNAGQSTTSIQSQIKGLDTLRSQALKQRTTQTQKTIRQQIKELDDLRASAQAGA